MKKQPIRIIIADDHTIFLQGLVSLLKSFNELEIIAAVTSGKDVLALLEHTDVDIVITDIHMPDMDGMQLSGHIKKTHPKVRVMALTMSNESHTISRMFKNGINGYVLKNTDQKELRNAINMVHRGETYVNEEIKAVVMDSILSRKTAKSVSALADLSSREIEILKLIASECTQQQIASKLCISTHTVIFHRRNLLHKLNAKNTAGLIKYAMEKGLLD